VVEDRFAELLQPRVGKLHLGLDTERPIDREVPHPVHGLVDER
jgi:hypothetical protein